MNALKIQIKALAENAYLDPEMLTILQRFFLDKTTEEEEAEMSKWTHHNEVHEALFDLLVELNGKEESRNGHTAMLRIYTHQPKSGIDTWDIVYLVLFVLALVYFYFDPPLLIRVLAEKLMR